MQPDEKRTWWRRVAKLPMHHTVEEKQMFSDDVEGIFPGLAFSQVVVLEVDP